MSETPDTVKPPLTPDEKPQDQSVVGTSPADDPAHTGYAVYDNALQRYVTGVHTEETAQSIRDQIHKETSADLGLTKAKIADRFEVRPV